MYLSDSSIKNLIDSGVLSEAIDEGVRPISYDLRTKKFYNSEGVYTEISLNPGESVYVGAVEIIKLPKDLSAVVTLRNSRIRQGLSLDAPIYFPGHHTRVFFRVTNVSSVVIDLDTKKGIAQILFERVEGKVLNSYEGTFSDEFDYRGMGAYSDIYSAKMRDLDHKRNELKGMESRIYERTIAIMAIFAAVFTLVNVNAGSALNGASLLNVNLSIIGGFSVLVGLIAVVLDTKSTPDKVIPFGVAILSFIASFLL